MILAQSESLSRPRKKYRVITYIDGFNLYFGIRREAMKRGSLNAPSPRWYRYLWLNLDQLSRNLLTEEQELVTVKYFTSPISGSKGKQDRQNSFLDALRTLPNCNITFGRFEPDRRECDNCGKAAFHPQEKKTDVNIAVSLIRDALNDLYDTAILITADSDLVPAVEAVKKLKPEKRLVVAFPPSRYSKELEDTTNSTSLHIWESQLRKSRFPSVISRNGLPDIVRPTKYSGESGCTV